MAGYPKHLTEVWQTSDGQFHATEAAAKEHELRSRAKSAIQQTIALYSFRRGNGEYSNPLDRGAVNTLVDYLIAAGLTMRLEDT